MLALPNDGSGRRSCYFCFIIIVVTRLFYYFDFYSCLSSLLPNPNQGRCKNGRLDLNNIYLSVAGRLAFDETQEI